MSEKQLDENGFVSEFHFQPHTEVLTHRLYQPNENLILDRNQRLRNEPEAFAKNEWIRPLCAVPLIMWEKAIRDGYDLNCPDKEIADKELFRYLRSPEGMTCMTTEEKI